MDSITAKVLQAIQSESQPLAFNTQSTMSTGVADATTVPEVATVDTAQIVSDVLQNLISGDRGEAGELLMNLPKPCLSLSNPLGATLPPELKAKICADEFVNLSCLLDMNQEDISVTWKTSGGNPTISLSNASKRDIVSIEQWTRAILVLAAVYTEKKPTYAPALFKYISLIRDMSYQRKDWKFYDDQCRRLKATSGVSWADINWELYFGVQASAINNTSISHYAQPPTCIPPTTAIHLGDRPGSQRDTASIITMQTHAHASDASSNMNVSPVIMESIQTIQTENICVSL